MAKSKPLSFRVRFQTVRALLLLVVWVCWFAVPVGNDMFSFPRWADVFLGPTIRTLAFGASFVAGLVSVVLVDRRLALTASMFALLPLLHETTGLWPVDEMDMPSAAGFLIGIVFYLTWIGWAPARTSNLTPVQRILVALLFSWIIWGLTLVPAYHGIDAGGFEQQGPGFWWIQGASVCLSVVGTLVMLASRSNQTRIAVLSLMCIWVPTVVAWLFIGRVASHYTVFLMPLTLVTAIGVTVVSRQEVAVQVVEPSAF